MTPKIKMGCNIYCTAQNVPINWDALLNASGLKTDRIFIVKCCSKKTIRKSAESAMANFLPIEEFSIPLIVELSKN